MKISLTVAFVLTLLWPVWAGSINIDLGGTPETINTAKYETAIQRLADEFNVRQLQKDPDWVTLTREQYTKRVFVSAFKSYVRQVRKRDAAEACATYADFDAIEKAEVDDLLGGKSPCL